MFVIIRKIFKSGLYSSQDSIKMSHLWTRTLFELGLYSSQASINDSTVNDNYASNIVEYIPLFLYENEDYTS